MRSYRNQSFGGDPRSNGLGLAGFIVSLVGIISCGLLSPIGMVMSFFALFRRPREFAIAGFIVGLAGSFWIIVWTVIVAVFVGFAALFAVVSAGGGFETLKDVWQIHEAVVEYENTNSVLPGSLDQVNLTPDQLTDAWGRPYEYTPDLLHHSYKLISAGPDGTIGTRDDITVEQELGPAALPSPPRTGPSPLTAPSSSDRLPSPAN